jgi:hypothetical protein
MIHAWALQREAMRRIWALIPTMSYFVLYEEDMCFGGWWRMAPDDKKTANDNGKVT